MDMADTESTKAEGMPSLDEEKVLGTDKRGEGGVTTPPYTKLDIYCTIVVWLCHIKANDHVYML